MQTALVVTPRENRDYWIRKFIGERDLMVEFVEPYLDTRKIDMLDPEVVWIDCDPNDLSSILLHHIQRRVEGKLDTICWKDHKNGTDV